MSEFKNVFLPCIKYTLQKKISEKLSIRYLWLDEHLKAWLALPSWLALSHWPRGSITHITLQGRRYYVKNLIWRALIGALSTNMNLLSRKVEIFPLLPFVGMRMRMYSVLQFNVGFILVNLIAVTHLLFLPGWNMISRYYDLDTVCKFFMLLWSLWWHRNLLVWWHRSTPLFPADSYSHSLVFFKWLKWSSDG